MDDTASGSSTSTHERALLQHYRKNFICHCLDGTLFIAGINFVSLTAILPVFVNSLSHSSVLVGLLTTTTVVGNSLPQLIAANAATTYERKMDLVVGRYAWGQRIPWLLMAMNAFFVIPRNPTLGLILFFVLYGVYTVSSGLTIPLWFDIVVKSVPADRRGRMLSARGVASGVASAAAGYAASYILRVTDYPNGYGILFSLAFASMMFSLVFFSLIWEPREKALVSRRPMVQYLRELPALMRGDRNFLTYLGASAFIGFGGMAAAFYTVYALDRLHLGLAYSGTFGAIILAAQTVSSMAWGAIADRHGYKLVLQVSLVLSCLAAMAAALATSLPAFFLVFVLFGAAAGGSSFAGLNVITEMCTAGNRPTYVGVANTFNAPVAGLSPLLGGLLVYRFGYHSVFVTSLVAIAVGLAIVSLRVKTVRFGIVD